VKTISQRRKQARWAYNGSVLKSKRGFRLPLGGNPSGCRLHTLACGLFLGFLFIAIIVAQEPSGKPETSTAKTGQATNPMPGTSLLTPKSAREPDTLPDLAALATEIAKYAAVKSCLTKNCSILVTNFLLPDGDTSRYGIQLADELSNDLASPGNKIQVTDRGLLQDLLRKDRVPGKFIGGTARTIALELESTFVVVGATQIKDDGTVQLSARLLDTVDKDWRGYSALVNLPAPKSSVDLVPSEPFPDLPPITNTASGETVVLHGATSPNCTYIPNPPIPRRLGSLW
jgi:hypothetical protein